MLKSDAAPTWNFRVLNNTNSDALYALDGAAFNSGATDSTRNLHAGSGWGTTSYTGTRAAAPFAILDTVFSATTLITSASPAAVFEPLDLFWSRDNRSGTTDQNGDFTTCIDDGDVQTTFFTTGGEDDCDGIMLPGIYVLGSFVVGANGNGGDTDEFDQHVIAHEFGHYVEVEFARSDSIGGEHGDAQKLDLRVAFGEGWGNAFSGMVLNDPIYRDSFSGASDDFRVDMEADDSRSEGWFSETSVQEILWDAFDATNESGDSLSLGFTPIFAALVGEQTTNRALTSIFSFLEALESAAQTSGTGIGQLRAGEQISGTDEFGSGENNAGGDPSVLPIYRPIALNQAQQAVCVRAVNGVFNKLGFAKFFRLDLTADSTVTINVVGSVDPATPAGVPAVDPDFYVYRRGETVAIADLSGSTETISQRALTAGTYIIEVYDYQLGGGTTPRCMTISVAGT
jgi:hypothetical protein